MTEKSKQINIVIDAFIEDKAKEYAKSVSKNETYQKYLKEAFMAGYLAGKKQ